MARKKPRDPLTPVCIKVPASLKIKLKKRAFKQDTTVSKMACEVLTKFIEEA